MATQLHYYGSVFDLADNTTDDEWARLIDVRFNATPQTGGFIWLDLRGGGKVSLYVTPDTPRAVVTGLKP